MSSSSTGGPCGHTGVRGAAVGAALIVFEAAVIGFAANAVNPNRLPWIRVPLRETHRAATPQEIRPSSPAPSSTPQATPVRSAAPATAPKAAAASVPVPVATGAPVPATAQPPKLAAKVAAVPSNRPAPKPASRTAPLAAPAVTPTVKKAEALFTSLSDAKALFDAKDALFIDARHQEDYAAEHIVGARNLFADEISDHYERVLGSVPKNRAVVTYCSDPQCDAAIKLADALVARGHTRVFILLEGIPGWRGAGYPTAKGTAP